MKQLRVLHLVHAFRTGGAERVLVHLCNHCDSSITNIVASFSVPDDFQLQIEQDRRDVRFLDKSPGNDWRVVLKIRSLIVNERIDVVHAQGWGAYIEALLAVLLVPRHRPRLVFAFHGKTMADLEHGVPLHRKLAQRFAYYLTDAIIAPARHMATDYALSIGIPEKAVQVIYNGVDAELFSQGYPGARAKLGIAPESFVVGFVGRLDPVKNLGTALEMFSAFLDLAEESQKPRMLLLVVGDGSERNSLEAHASRLGIENQVLFLGQRCDVPSCLAAMDLYLQPSFYEGHSFTILEAMAAGLPVITSRVGGNGEIISQGDNGFLCDPLDVGGVAATLLDLFSDPLKMERVGEKASKSVLAAFDRKSMIRKYQEAFYAA